MDTCYLSLTLTVPVSHPFHWVTTKDPNDGLDSTCGLLVRDLSSFWMSTKILRSLLSQNLSWSPVIGLNMRLTLRIFWVLISVFEENTNMTSKDLIGGSVRTFPVDSKGDSNSSDDNDENSNWTLPFAPSPFLQTGGNLTLVFRTFSVRSDEMRLNNGSSLLLFFGTSYVEYGVPIYPILGSFIIVPGRRRLLLLKSQEEFEREVREIPYN